MHKSDRSRFVVYISLPTTFKSIIKQMNSRFLFTVLMSLFSFSVIAQTGAGKAWTKTEAKKWFKQKEWLGGLVLSPHKSVDQTEFARQYHANKIYWDKAFAFLKDHDLNKMEKGKYPIDGDNVYATITEDTSKDFEKTNWESHRNYIDIQHVINGEEKIGVYPVSKATVTKEYDAQKDVANYSAKGKFYSATPDNFFIFFPTDAHRPNITPGGNKVVKKIVFKVRAAE
jgi:YhcH/YjgK/YiaL family protein